jgi:hypothetical protein
VIRETTKHKPLEKKIAFELPETNCRLQFKLPVISE